MTGLIIQLFAHATGKHLENGEVPIVYPSGGQKNVLGGPGVF